MNYRLPLLCFLFLCNRVSAQHSRDSSRQVSAQQSADSSGQATTQYAGDSPRQATARLKASMSALSRTTIRFRMAGTTFYPGLFSHFEVIDERADTARVGIRAMTGPFSHNHQRQLVFGKPAATEIADYLNGHFSRQGAPFTALVVLRTLWLTDANYIREDLVKDPDKKLDNFQIRLKAEVYAARDSLYMPVFRYDTLVTMKDRDYSAPYLQTPFSALQSFYPLMEAGLSDLFNDLADSASLIAGRKTGNGRKVRREEILEFNRSRFTMPADNGAVYVAGVYASFEEFRNNAPSIRDFEIKKEKKDILLYIKGATGTSYYSHDAWGYCDGVSLFVMRDGILWPAWKEGKAIYFYGLSDKIKTVQREEYNPGTQGYTTTPRGTVASGTPAYSAPYTTTEKEKVKCIYTVDMDSGEVY